MPRTSASANSTGRSNSTPSSGTTSTSRARQSNSTPSSGTTSTSRARQSKSTSSVTNCTSTSTSGTRQKPIQQPKCNNTSRNDTDSLISSFSQLRLNNCSSKGCNENTGKTPYDVARKESPNKPGIYKMYRKNKDEEVYIGHSKDLKRRINDHPYGPQVVDQFLRKEKDNVEVKVELAPTKDDARVLEKKELAAFKEQHDRLPEFNRRM